MPDVRVYFVQYDAIAILDRRIVIAQAASFDRLYSTAFSAAQPFWVKGSRQTEKFSGNIATPGILSRIDHVDDIAIYNNTDNDFMDFVNFTLERWKITLP